MFDSIVLIRLKPSYLYLIMADFAGEHSSPLQNANEISADQLIRSKSNSFCFPYRSLQNMRRENYNHNSLGEYLFFSAILFCYPFSSPISLYHKSAEKTSSLPKFCAYEFSVKSIAPTVFCFYLRSIVRTASRSPSAVAYSLSSPALLPTISATPILPARICRCGSVTGV